MTDLPNYYLLCPTVAIYFGPECSSLVISVRRWTSDGKHTTEDGIFLWDRADWILKLPTEDETLGKTITKGLHASRQFGKRIPKLAKPVREAVNVPDRSTFDALFYPLVVWTHRDETTPYVIGAARSNKVNLDRVVVPKNSSNKQLGRKVLDFTARVEKLNWNF